LRKILKRKSKHHHSNQPHLKAAFDKAHRLLCAVDSTDQRNTLSLIQRWSVVLWLEELD